MAEAALSSRKRRWRRFSGVALWRCRNAACGAGATVGAAPGARRILAGAVLGVALASAALAGPPPTGEEALDAWRQVEDWVRAWTPPEEADHGDHTLPVGVTLRYNGRIIGRGLDVSGAPGSLGRACAQALREADLRLPVDADALMLESVELLAAQVAISLELGGEPEALPAASMLEVAERLSPGLEGVIVRIGDRQAGMLPGMMLATGTDAAAATAIAFREVAGERARQLAGPAIDIAAAADAMLARRDAAVYRAPVTHLAQPAPELPPMFLYRGGRVALLEEINTEAMRRWAASMATFALGRGYPGSERLGLLGALDPLAGQSLQVTAAPAQQAVMAIALLRYSRMERAEPALARSCDVFATGLLRDLAVVEQGETPPWQAPHDAAAVVAALLEIEPAGNLADERLAELLERCAPAVTGSFTALGGFGEAVPPGAEAIVAWAMVRLAAAQRADPAMAQAAVRSVFRKAGEGDLVTHMPWIWWAEAELAGPEGEIAAAGALRAAREVVWRHQLGPADVDLATRDFVGGMVFTGAGPALPTWNTARPLTALAGMLGDQRITPDGEFLSEFNRVRAGLRFLRQLTADEATGHMYRHPAPAAGGVRAAPWDQNMPPDATSLSLLCVIETLEAMEAFLARQAG